MTKPAWLLAALLGLSGLARAGQESSCVACHRQVSGKAYVLHDFADWSGSPHARAGVSCQACHGGDARAAKQDAAHKGMLSSKDSRSSVYYTKVPATCGGCHRAEFDAFKKSAHARELKGSGRGPNCVTCHGAMANRVMTARELETTCTLCHRRPTLAFAAMLMLDGAKTGLRRLKSALREGRAKGAEFAQQEKDCSAAAEIYQASLRDWHSFLMDKVVDGARKATQLTNKALREIDAKARSKP